MLKMIECDKFIEDGKPRGPINFKMGLNTVLGDDKASNSIGKSTLMMIIDFCFGGDDYKLKETDTLSHVGPHTIKFIFEFDKKNFYFTRSIEDYLHVNICDDNFNVVNTITRDQFKNGLLHHYNLQNHGLSFRDWVSPFFRIYNRKTHNEMRPINAHIREADGSGIECLLKMFGVYGNLDDEKKAYEIARSKKNYFESMSRFTPTNICKNDSESMEFEEELECLKKQLNILISENKTGASDSSVYEMEQKKDLRKQRDKLRKQRSDLESQKNDIKISDSYDERKFQKQYEGLLRYFPKVKIDDIKALEKFHKDVAKFLEEDIVESNNNIDQMLTLIDEQLSTIEKELLEYKSVPIVSEEYIKQRKLVEDRIKLLETAIDNYKKKKTALDEFSASKKALESSVGNNTQKVQKFLNKKMDEYNDRIRAKEKKYAPHFEFNKLDSYAFYTPNDTGTGARFKGVCLLDLAILDGTKLPAIAHDSIMFTNIEDQTAIDIVKIYSTKTTKQIFACIEKPSRYNEKNEDGSIVNIAIANKCIQLGENGKALFGRQRDKVEENPE